MTRKAIWLTAFVAFALIAGMVLLRQLGTADPEESSRVELPMRLSPAIMAVPIAAVTPSQPVALPARPSLMQDLNASTNYREFIAVAKAHVERGGAAYAMWAMVECDYINKVLRTLAQNPPPPATDSKNIVARAESKILLESRCGVLMQAETDVLAYRKSLIAEGRIQADPLLNILSMIYVPSYKTDPAARRALVSAILESQDGLLWDRYSDVMVNSDYQKHQVYFDGMIHDLDKEPELEMARGLVVCGLGRECDARHDLYVAQICVQLTICEHDRFELVKLQADARGIDFAKVMAVYDRMVGAFRDRDVEAFVQS